MSGIGKTVCVTGASGYVASWLVKLLLLRGYTVNGTVRCLDEPNKVRHLVELEGAKERLRLFKADLMEEGLFDRAIDGCDGVFHVASPCYLSGIEDPKAELLDPAVGGTINVLNSCAKFPSVRRVVLTSSIGAMLLSDRPITPETVVDETWWSDPEFCQKEKKWYGLSKLLAEQAAWEYAREKGIDLVSICPGVVLGPSLQPMLKTSCAHVFNLIGAKSYPSGGYGWIHVKDVANAHIQAFELQSTSGRYCLVERDLSISDIVKNLHKLCPTLQLPDKCDRANSSYVQQCNFSKERAENLGINYTPIETCLEEMIKDFRGKHLIRY